MGRFRPFSEMCCTNGTRPSANNTPISLLFLAFRKRSRFSAKAGVWSCLGRPCLIQAHSIRITVCRRPAGIGSNGRPIHVSRCLTCLRTPAIYEPVYRNYCEASTAKGKATRSDSRPCAEWVSKCIPMTCGASACEAYRAHGDVAERLKALVC